MKFSEYELLTESSLNLASSLSDILDSISRLSEEQPNLKYHSIKKGIDNVTNRIRTILSSKWDEENDIHLKSLQKIGVALAKVASEDKENVIDILNASIEELQKIIDKLGVPSNSLSVSNKDIKFDNKEKESYNLGDELKISAKES